MKASNIPPDFAEFIATGRISIEGIRKAEVNPIPQA